MKKLLFTLCAVLCLPTVGWAQTFKAYDFAAENEYGTTIYYIFTTADEEEGIYEVEVANRELNPAGTSHTDFYVGHVVIPDEVYWEGGWGNTSDHYLTPFPAATYKVTGIGARAFAKCTALTEVTIGANVRSIGYSREENQAYGATANCFLDCTGLEQVNFSDAGCLTYIGEGSFDGCTALRTVVLPEGLTAIGDDMFYGCTALRTVTLPEGLATMGDGVFYGCTALRTVTLPEGLAAVGARSFWECTALRTIVLPERLATVGDMTFYGCTALRSVTLPAEVNYVGDRTFYGCTALRRVVMLGSAPPSVDDDATTRMFEKDTQGVNIYVPTAALTAYTSGAWSNLTNTSLVPYASTLSLTLSITDGTPRPAGGAAATAGTTTDGDTATTADDDTTTTDTAATAGTTATTAGTTTTDGDSTTTDTATTAGSTTAADDDTTGTDDTADSTAVDSDDGTTDSDDGTTGLAFSTLFEGEYDTLLPSTLAAYIITDVNSDGELLLAQLTDDTTTPIDTTTADGTTTDGTTTDGDSGTSDDGDSGTSVDTEITRTTEIAMGGTIPAGTAALIAGDLGTYSDLILVSPDTDPTAGDGSDDTSDDTSDGTTDGTLDGTSDSNMLYGSDTATTTTVHIGVNAIPDANDADYYFYKLTTNAQGDTDSAGFYWGASDGSAFDMPAAKAWLAVPRSVFAADGVKRLKMKFPTADDPNVDDPNVDDPDGSGSSDGISSVGASVAPAREGIYTLQGVRVADVRQSGVYIIDGRKVLVR